MRKIEREKETVRWMIEFYCRKRHTRRNGVCDECDELLKYAGDRLDHCPYGEKKTSCKRCRVPCYAPEKRKAIRKVMRYSAPRMIYHKPVEWMNHLFK